jgi:N-methylhydantoinase B/oxoprolinase/acetone carboxylase alpha subunit
MRPGDVYAANDPYNGGGTHLSDPHFDNNDGFFRPLLNCICVSKFLEYTQVGSV